MLLCTYPFFAEMLLCTYPFFAEMLLCTYPFFAEMLLCTYPFSPPTMPPLSVLFISAQSNMSEAVTSISVFYPRPDNIWKFRTLGPCQI
jgi:hypothetical protein